MVKLMPETMQRGGVKPASSSTLPDQVALKNDASAALDEARNVAGSIAEEAKAQGAQILDQAKSQLSDATDKAREVAEHQKTAVASQVAGVADAIGKVADELETTKGPGSEYARMIADNAQRLSSTIGDKSVDELLGIAQDFGRKQPAAFIGAAALLGFVASRFVMASASRTAPPAEAAISSVPASSETGGANDSH